MTYKTGSAFDSIESAHEFVTLLAATVGEAKREVEADIQRESTAESPRRLDALRTALYSMEKLELHMNQSRRILNDLRSLRRLHDSFARCPSHQFDGLPFQCAPHAVHRTGLRRGCDGPGSRRGFSEGASRRQRLDHRCRTALAYLSTQRHF